MEKCVDYTTFDYFKIVITETSSNKRIDRLLSEEIDDVSRSKLKKLIDGYFVLLNGNPTEPSYLTKIGDIIEVKIPEPEDVGLEAQDIPLDIVYEDETLLVINKRANMVMHPGNGNFRNTLLNGLLFINPESKKLPRAGIVHRLDKDTTGLIVVAKNQFSFNSLSEQIAKKNIIRVYFALVWGQLLRKVEKIGNIKRDRSNRLRFIVSNNYDGKYAHTSITPLDSGYIENKKVTLVECLLSTGRTHQIRVHLEDIGNPIVGDTLYKRGAPRGLKRIVLNRQALHAYKLSFCHPEKKQQMTFEAQPPSDLTSQIKIAKICHNLSSK